MNKSDKKRNISISGIFIAMVMTIVIISTIAAMLIFVQIYKNAMEQSAVTSGTQISGQVLNTVENYTNEMQNVMQQIVLHMRKGSLEDLAFIQNMVEIRSDIVAVTTYDKDGNLLDCWNNGQELKRKSADHAV